MNRLRPTIMTKAQNLSRRHILRSALATPAIGGGFENLSAASAKEAAKQFAVTGTYLNAAAVHPMMQASIDAVIATTTRHKQGFKPGEQPVHIREVARSAFARLIAAEPEEISFVSGTMAAENMLSRALGLGTDAGVVTDDLHFDGSLALYCDQQKRGMPLRIVRNTDGVVSPEALIAATDRSTRLIALSLISNVNGFCHDLEEICHLAHQRGILVYADIIQAAGAIPIDVKKTGVDFCACSSYKWLMGGDFGLGFLYVSKDALARLRKPVTAWPQLEDGGDINDPFDNHPITASDFSYRSGSRGYFEVSLPGDMACAAVVESLRYIQQVTPGQINRNKQELFDCLRSELRDSELRLMTPPGQYQSLLAFACRDAEVKFGPVLRKADIWIQLYPNRIRIAPSVYNTREDMELLASVLRGNTNL